MNKIYLSITSIVVLLIILINLPKKSPEISDDIEVYDSYKNVQIIGEDVNYDQAGSFKVKTLEYRNLKDAKRDNRNIPIKIHYPQKEGTYPLVIFSHGGMGTWDSFIYQAEHLASYGYVVLSVEHVFSNNEKTKEHIRKAKGGWKEKVNEAILRMTTDPKSVLERPKDITFAIDRAVEWNREKSELKGRINTDKIAVIGHSYGAYTVLAVCGARPILDYLKPVVEPGKGLAPDLSDPRVTVGVAMSPQGLGTSRFGKESYKTIDRPLLCFSGTKDDQFGHDGSTQPAKKRLEGFRFIPDGKKHMLWLENTDHFAFADNHKSYLFPSESRVDTQRITKTMTLLFCDIYLKDKKEAKKKFTKKYANALCGEVVTKIEWFESSEEVDIFLKKKN